MPLSFEFVGDVGVFNLSDLCVLIPRFGPKLIVFLEPRWVVDHVAEREAVLEVKDD